MKPLIQTENQSPRTRAEINRENAQKSTGPRTPVGKHNAATNGFRHHLTRQVMCLTEDDATHYLDFTNRMVKEFVPVTMHEEQLAQRIADCTWRMNRMRAMETHVLTLAFNAKEDKIVTDHPQVHGALATADGLSQKLQDLGAISIHEQRICRQHAQALKQLDEAQTKRKANQQQELNQAANLYELHKEDHPEPGAPVYEPREDGFAFTVAQIDSYISRQVRVRRSLDCEITRFKVAR
jgi:hypothetical protein